METLRENDFLRKNGDDEEGAAGAHLVNIVFIWRSETTYI